MAEFEALLARRQEEQRSEFLRAGIVAAAVINANPFRAAGSRAADPLDFVPDYTRVQKREQTLDEQIAELTRILGCGPGKKA